MFFFCVKDAASYVIIRKNVACPECGEQIRLKRFSQRSVLDIDVRVWRERTRLCSAVRVYVEESPARCQAATRALLVSREGDVYHVLLAASKFIYPCGHELAVGVIRCKMRTFIRDRHELYIEHGLASAGPEFIQEFVGIYLLHVLFRDRNRHAVDDAFFA